MGRFHLALRGRSSIPQVLPVGGASTTGLSRHVVANRERAFVTVLGVVSMDVAEEDSEMKLQWAEQGGLAWLVSLGL